MAGEHQDMQAEMMDERPHDSADGERDIILSVKGLTVSFGTHTVLDHLDLSKTSLVLLEYQNRKNRLQLEARLAACPHSRPAVSRDTTDAPYPRGHRGASRGGG